AAPLPYRQSGFQAVSGGAPEGWTTWSARSEIAPRTFVDSMRSIGEPGSLAISGASNAAAHGGWERTLPVEPGRWYRFSAAYLATGLTYERGQVLARLDWRKADGARTGMPDYAWHLTREGDWHRLTAHAPAPADAASVVIQLYLSNAPQATLWWDDVSLEAAAPPPPRLVTVVSLNLRPANTASPADSIARFVALAEKAAPAKTDLILLPEGATVVGTGKTASQVAETVPGPTTAALGALALKRGAWVVAGLYERDGAAIYNTAVLIDRRGKLAGRYRKVYLPREEIEEGLTPGLEYPVFDTDFGRIGIMICWDLQYADPARALALGGAELILLPIWGGNQTLAKARAIENHVFLAASGYDYPTQIIDPVGEVIGAAPGRGAAAVATIDLNHRYVEEWLGEMRGRFMKELRLDVPLESR
ncbi:MAG TPA: carbon-nitrogen hydrolase family protein, partial [Bryobacteraceae bacterium]